MWDEPPISWSLPGDVKLAFAMPCYGPIYPQVYANHLAVISYTSRFLDIHKIGSIPLIGTTDRMYLHTACNTTVREFLASDCTHIFWTESDMLMPMYAVVKLLEYNKPICSGVYFLRNGGGQPCLYLKGGMSVQSGVTAGVPVAVFPEDSFFKVHCPGMGCVLIAREVFEKVEPPWFDLREGWTKEDKKEKIFGYGQDIYFYSKVATAGFDVWVDSGIHCAQVFEDVVTIDDYRKRVLSPTFKANGAIIGQGVVESSNTRDAEVVK